MAVGLFDLVDCWEVAETVRRNGGRDSVGVSSDDMVGCEHWLSIWLPLHGNCHDNNTKMNSGGIGRDLGQDFIVADQSVQEAGSGQLGGPMVCG